MRGQDRRPIAYGNHAVRPRRQRFGQRTKRAVDVVEADGDRAVTPRVVETIAPIRRDQQLDSKSGRDVIEGADLIPGRSSEKQNAGHG
jgi:hypothetical protein